MKDSSRKQGAAASPCAACKLLRRRCAHDCVFAPYFPADEPQKFASVHKVFGASNVNKMLQELRGTVTNPWKVKPSLDQLMLMPLLKVQSYSSFATSELPEHQRGDAVSSMVYEANARVRDPVYGCVGAISSLQQQIDVLQTQLALAQAEVVHMRMRQFSSSMNNSPENAASPSSRDTQCHQAKSLFSMDMVEEDHPNMEHSSLWHN